MTLSQLSQEYAAAAELISRRLALLRQAQRDAADPLRRAKAPAKKTTKRTVKKGRKTTKKAAKKT